MASETGKGLEGVVAAETAVSDIDGKKGLLYYVGYDIHDLADNATFEEIIYLLHHLELPNARPARGAPRPARQRAGAERVRHGADAGPGQDVRSDVDAPHGGLGLLGQGSRRLGHLLGGQLPQGDPAVRRASDDGRLLRPPPEGPAADPAGREPLAGRQLPLHAEGRQGRRRDRPDLRRLPRRSTPTTR